MHLISKIEIKNFRSIKGFTFDLSSYTPLVGYNNAGKTTLLHALSWIVKPTSLKESDYCDPEMPVEIIATISGITAKVLSNIAENHRAKIEPLVKDEVMRLRRVQTKPDQKTKDSKLQVEETLEDDTRQWKDNVTGIDQAILNLFPEPIFIGAMENATDDVAKFGASSTIGKLLNNIMGAVVENNSDDLKASLSDLTNRLSATSEQKDETLAGLDIQIQKEISNFFPGVAVKTHIPTPDFSMLFKNATVQIFEEEFPDKPRDVSAFGHGAQRAIQIALVKCLAQSKQENTEGRTTLLIIDEPELYLHPQAIELIRAALKRLSKNGFQVVFTTHSASMIQRDDAAEALLIRKSVNSGTTCYPKISTAVEKTIAHHDKQADLLFALSHSPKFLFSEKTILAEGQTEKIILPDLFEILSQKTLYETKAALIDVGGVNNVPGARKVLKAMGQKTKAIVDLDFAFNAAIQDGLIKDNNPDIMACRAIFSEMEQSTECVLADNGLPRKHNGEPASKAYERLAKKPTAKPHIQALHQILLQEDIWLWKLGAIEAHIGLNSKNTTAQRQFIENFREHKIAQEASDLAAIKELVAWLAE